MVPTARRIQDKESLNKESKASKLTTTHTAKMLCGRQSDTEVHYKNKPKKRSGARHISDIHL